MLQDSFASCWVFLMAPLLLSVMFLCALIYGAITLFCFFMELLWGLYFSYIFFLELGCIANGLLELEQDRYNYFYLLVSFFFLLLEFLHYAAAWVL